MLVFHICPTDTLNLHSAHNTDKMKDRQATLPAIPEQTPSKSVEYRPIPSEFYKIANKFKAKEK